MWPSTTKALAPFSPKPLPDRTACIVVCSGRCFGALRRSRALRAATPSAIFGRCSDFCAALPPRDSADAASTAVDRNGDGIRLRPISSITTPASTQPSPLPPKFSGTSSPANPISAKARHRSRENPVASLVVAELAQMRHRRLVADEASRAVAQHRLFFVEDECHQYPLAEIFRWSFRRGAKRRTRNDGYVVRGPRQIGIRLATMPSITSLVPPSIELALVRSQARGLRAAVERSLSHSSASTPPADIRIS